MPRIRIEAELSEEQLRAYEGAAKRQGVPVELLVQQTVKVLLQEMAQEQNDSGCPMVPC